VTEINLYYKIVKVLIDDGENIVEPSPDNLANHWLTNKISHSKYLKPCES
jgi:hypothetical protein